MKKLFSSVQSQNCIYGKQRMKCKIISIENRWIICAIVFFGMAAFCLSATELSIKIYETVNDMLNAQDLRVGQRIKTYEYNAPIISNWEVVDTLEKSDFGLKLENGKYARLIIDRINILAFGAVSGEEDSYSAIQAAVDYAIVRSRENYIDMPRTFAAPAVEIFFPAGNYNISKPVSNRGYPCLSFVGEGQSTVYRKTSGEDDKFLFEFTGVGFNINFRDLNMVATPAGCVDLFNKNRSSSMIEFLRCRFICNPETYSATGVVIDNQSACVEFKHCLFQNIKHPAHIVNCDFACFDGCWFGFPFNAEYKDRDALIKHDSGFLKVTKCLFAGGPAHGKGGAKEVAYFNVGVETTDGPTFHPLLLVENCRIGFEWGAGAVVNYFADSHGYSGKTGFRNGVIFKNNQFAPREEKKETIGGAMVSPIVRLFTLPHMLVIEDSSCTHTWALVGAGSGISLKELRESAGLDFNFSNFDQMNRIRPAYSYSASGLVGSLGFVAATPDLMEYSRWARIFGVFNYFFPSRTEGEPSLGTSIDTFYDHFSAEESGLYEVCMDVEIISPVQREVLVVAGDINVWSRGDQLVTTFSRRESKNGVSVAELSIKSVFVVGDQEFQGISREQAPAAALSLNVSSVGNDQIICRGAVIKPFGSDMPSAPFNGSPTMLFPLQSR